MGLLALMKMLTEMASSRALHCLKRHVAEKNFIDFIVFRTFNLQEVEIATFLYH